MPRKSGSKKTATAAPRRSGSLFTSPADAAAMKDARGTSLNQDPKTGMWVVRNAAGKIVGKCKSQSAGRRLRYKVEQAQGLKVNATTIKRARKSKTTTAKSATAKKSRAKKTSARGKKATAAK